MGQLSKLPNIGKVIESELEQVGIDTIDEFKALGSKTAWLKLQQIDSSVCLEHLYALEGAIEGIRWHDLDKETKDDLKSFYNKHQIN